MLRDVLTPSVVYTALGLLATAQPAYVRDPSGRPVPSRRLPPLHWAQSTRLAG